MTLRQMGETVETDVTVKTAMTVETVETDVMVETV